MVQPMSVGEFVDVDRGLGFVELNVDPRNIDPEGTVRFLIRNVLRKDGRSSGCFTALVRLLGLSGAALLASVGAGGSLDS